MSFKTPSPFPIKHKSTGIFPSLTKSLLGRQLFSSIIITIVGLSILSSFYYYAQQKSHIKHVQENAENLYNDLSGVLDLNPDTGRYIIEDPALYEDLKGIVRRYQLTSDSVDHFAYITNTKTGQLIWHSQAYEDTNTDDTSKPPYSEETLKILPVFTFKKVMKEGEKNVEFLVAKNSLQEGRNIGNSTHLVYSRAFTEESINLLFVDAQSSKEIESQKSDVIQKIGILILISTLLTLVAQLVNSYLVITPIKRFEKEIKNIESGKQEFVKANYPTELVEVKGAINALVQVEKGQKKRYRESLDNLAHSLKTPLAILQGFAENNNSMNEKENAILVNQVTRMNEIIAYQLRRAVVNDHNTNIQRLDIRPILYRLKNSLPKVHHDKFFKIEVHVDENTECRMGQDDLMEVFGNLINNACRFCVDIVTITAVHDGDFIIVDIDDDGLGFPDVNPSGLLNRGIRADNKTEGQGIGLALSNEIVEAAGGRIELLVSPYVGARVRLYLPV